MECPVISRGSILVPLKVSVDSVEVLSNISKMDGDDGAQTKISIAKGFEKMR